MQTYRNVLPRNRDVHSPQTRDKVHWDKNRTKRSELGENIVDLIIGIRHFDRDLSEIIAMRARQNLLVMIQILRHRNQMVLDI